MIGAPDDNPTAASVGAGAAYVFQGSGASWAQRQKLTANLRFEKARFGNTVGISQGNIVVGFDHSLAIDAPSGSINNAELWRRSGTSWSRVGILRPDEIDVGQQGVDLGDLFGQSVAIDDGVILAGAPGHGAGAAFAFGFGTQQAGVIKLNLGTLNPGESVDLEVTIFFGAGASASGQAPQENRANVYGGVFDSNLPDNTDLAGTGVNHTATTCSDDTPPVINHNTTGALGDNGWHTSEVTVSWTITDAQSPGSINIDSGCVTSNVTADTTGATFFCTASSPGGTATAEVTIQLDTTPPNITPSANQPPGSETVEVSYDCADATSGIQSCTGAQTVFPGSIVTGTAVDRAGNRASAGLSIPVADPGPNQVLLLQPPFDSCIASASLDGSGSFDPSAPPQGLTHVWTNAVTINGAQAAFNNLGPGEHSFTLSVTNALDQVTASKDVIVTVVDPVPPVFNSDVPAPATRQQTAFLTPAPIGLPTATDNCGGPVSVVSDAPAGGYPQGTTPVTFTATDEFGNQAFAATTVTITPAFDLTIAKRNQSEPALAGAIHTYEFDVANSGISDASGVIFEDQLAPEMTFVEGVVDTTGVPVCNDDAGEATCEVQFDPDPNCDAAGQLVTCRPGIVPAGETITVAFRALIDPDFEGALSNSATVRANPGETDTANNDSGVVATPVASRADLSIIKRAPPGEVFSTFLLTYDLEVTNHGPFNTTNVRVTDDLPAGTSLNSATFVNPGVVDIGFLVPVEADVIQQSDGINKTFIVPGPLPLADRTGDGVVDSQDVQVQQWVSGSLLPLEVTTVNRFTGAVTTDRAPSTFATELLVGYAHVLNPVRAPVAVSVEDDVSSQAGGATGEFSVSRTPIADQDGDGIVNGSDVEVEEIRAGVPLVFDGALSDVTKGIIAVRDFDTPAASSIVLVRYAYEDPPGSIIEAEEDISDQADGTNRVFVVSNTPADRDGNGVVNLLDVEVLELRRDTLGVNQVDPANGVVTAGVFPRADSTVIIRYAFVDQQPFEDAGSQIDGANTVFATQFRPLADHNNDGAVNPADVQALDENLNELPVASVDAGAGEIALASPPAVGSRVFLSYTYAVGTRVEGDCSLAGITVTCDLGDMPAGVRANVTVKLDAGGVAPGPLANTAEVAGVHADPDTSNNSSSVDVDLLQAPEVTLNIAGIPIEELETFFVGFPGTISFEVIVDRIGATPHSFDAQATFQALGTLPNGCTAASPGPVLLTFPGGGSSALDSGIVSAEFTCAEPSAGDQVRFDFRIEVTPLNGVLTDASDNVRTSFFTRIIYLPVAPVVTDMGLISPPREIPAGRDTTVTLRVTVRNDGPPAFGPLPFTLDTGFDLTSGATGCAVNTTTFSDPVLLPPGTDVPLAREFTFSCEPGDHTFDFFSQLRGGDSNQLCPVDLFDCTNDFVSGSYQATALPPVDIEVAALNLVSVSPIPVDTPSTVTLTPTVRYNTGQSPAQVELTLEGFLPAACNGTLPGPQAVTLGAPGDEASLDFDINDFQCSLPGSFQLDFTVIASVSGPVLDTNDANSSRSTSTIVTVNNLPQASCPDDVLLSNYQTSPGDRQFAEVTNVGSSPINLSGCALVTFNVFTETSIGEATVGLSGDLPPGETFRIGSAGVNAGGVDVTIPDGILPSGPGAIGLYDVTPPPPDGTPFSTENEITGMVYLSSTMVFAVGHLRAPAYNTVYACIYGGSGQGPFEAPDGSFTPVADCLNGP